MAKSVKVIFKPEGRSVFCLPGTTVLEAATQAGITLYSPCGGEGRCGKCRVKIIRGKVRGEKGTLIGEEERKRGVRLACQTKIYGPAAIEIPPSSHLVAQQILTSGFGKKEVDLSLRKVLCEKDTPRIPAQVKSNKKDLVRIRRALKSGRATLIFAKDKYIGWEKGDTRRDFFGVAIDLGTTTVVASLLNLESGEELALVARLNPQGRFGEDIISRIDFIRSKPYGLKEMQAVTAALINEMIADLCRQAGVSQRRIWRMTLAGNPAMQHIFLGVSPEGLAEIPFSPKILNEVTASARSLKVKINPAASVLVFPGIGGFVGGDAVAAILASGIWRSERTRLLIDIGTNGEVILGNRKGLLCASTAAGPAFEGGGISSGMRAANGAIEKVLISSRLEVNVIGGGKPAGICGSGLLDLVAEMKRQGIIEESGKIVASDKLPRALSAALRRRVIAGKGFLVAEGKETKTGQPIFLSQIDIRKIQPAKAAIRTAAAVLCREMGVEEDKLDEVMLAGAFGNFIRPESVKEIGLIPHPPSGRFIAVGNAALSGAEMLLLSRGVERRMKKVVKIARHVELSRHPEFEEEFVSNMKF